MQAGYDQALVDKWVNEHYRNTREMAREPMQAGYDQAQADRNRYVPPNAPFGPHYNASEAAMHNAAAENVAVRGDMVHGPELYDEYKGPNPNWISEEPWGYYKRKAEEGSISDKTGFGIKNWLHDHMPNKLDKKTIPVGLRRWWENR